MNIILKTLSGSRLYGTHNEDSDYDYRGIGIQGLNHILGFMPVIGQQSGAGDDVVYDIKKFFELASKCNPNIVEILYAPERFWVKQTDIGEALVASRHMFLSTKARHTFSGYAHAQLKRMRGHKKWLVDPPTHQPTREEYCLPKNHKVIPNITPELLNKLAMSPAVPEELRSLLLLEYKYQQALKKWDGYVQWLDNRNPARAKLEAEYGFDGKAGSHLIRLMRSCVEILRDGELCVVRPDATELKDIRSGKWSYEEVLEHAEDLDEQAEVWYHKSPLPRNVNINRLNSLCSTLIMEHHGL